jgi:hypothetical protein
MGKRFKVKDLGLIKNIFGVKVQADGILLMLINQSFFIKEKLIKFGQQLATSSSISMTPGLNLPTSV